MTGSSFPLSGIRIRQVQLISLSAVRFLECYALIFISLQPDFQYWRHT